MRSPPMMEHLPAVHRPARAAAWTAQPQDTSVAPLGFNERFALLGQAEWLARERTRVQRTLQAAQQPRRPACVEALDSLPRRERDQAVVRPLVTGWGIAAPQAVLLRGAMGTGRPPPRRAAACARRVPPRSRSDRSRGWRGSAANGSGGIGVSRGEEPAGVGLARQPLRSGARRSYQIETRRDPAGPVRGTQRGSCRTRLPAPLAGADRVGGPADSQ